MTDAALSQPQEASLRDWWSLLKPRVMSLVIFTAAAGMIAAPGAAHPVLALASVLCIAVGAGASGALNQWWDADIDAIMKRTMNRPVPSGRIAAGEALGFGLGLSILSVMLLSLAANPLAGALLAFTIFFYAVVYTMWLKRATPQNIVIGGLAGALPPMIGWAAATGEVTLSSALMVLVIFLWTPAHFWALALFIQDDYRRAGVPMLPVVAGQRATRRQVLLYAVLTALASLALALSPAGGPLTLIGAAAVNGPLVWRAIQTARRDGEAAQADRHRVEKRLFAVSILHLFVLFGALMLDSAFGWSGLLTP